MQRTTAHKIQPSVTILAKGTVIEGTITTSDDINNDGEIRGDIKSNGKCVISQNGNLDGNVIAGHLIIAGNVDGKVNVNGLLEILESGKVKGSILTEKIMIQAGAVFTGNCMMKNASEKQSVEGEIIPARKAAGF